MLRPAARATAVSAQRRAAHYGGSYAGYTSVKSPQHMQHWLEASTGNHFRNWDRMGPEDIDHAHRARAMGTWFQGLKWGDYIVVKRAKDTDELIDHGIYMGFDRGICTYTKYKNPVQRKTLWLGKNLMIWLEPELFALEDDEIYVNDMLVYSPDPDKTLGEPLLDD
ncbi:hypothetical protein DIPPA_12945 [Diplonema papillatum]|nr:hypothetical protein DIPPA_12945 [Diplonema papillatum]